MVECNMCNAAMRGIDVLPGSRAHHAQMDHVGTWDIPHLVVRVGGPHREGEEP
jgi:hypothetical protein